MTRPSFRRSLRFENLESRELLSGMTAPTAQEQYMLELVNQARMNPQAAAVRVASNITPDIQSTLDYYHVDLNTAKEAIANSPAKPPLAWNPSLAAAAQAHTQDMVVNQFQSHSGSNGSTADQRMQQAGYTGSSFTGENAYAYANTVDEAMQAFLIDWGVSDSGHRRNLLQANVPTSGAFKDTGIGIASTSNSKVGPLVITQDFGTQPNTPAQLVGVVYSDPGHTGQYQLNSGQGNVQIDATNLASGQTTSVQTWDTGGYQIPLDQGKYQVTASQNNKVIQTTLVTIGTDNVEQDFLVDGPWDGRTRGQVLASVRPPAAPAPVASVAAASTPAAPTTPAPTPIAPAPTPVAPAPTSLPVSIDNPTWLGSWSSWKAKTA